MTSIYFIICREASAVKIGWAQDVRKRLVEHQCGCPFNLELIGQLAGGRADEAHLHLALRNSRIRGEWFAERAALDLLDRVHTHGLESVLAACDTELDSERERVRIAASAATSIVAAELPASMPQRDQIAWLASRCLTDHDFLNRWLKPMGMASDGQRIVQMSLAA